MAKPTIVTRAGKGSALTWTEGDSNLTNLKDATITLQAGTGGTNVVSDLNGTVTLVAGTNVTLSGDNSAKTVTINSTASGGASAINDLTDVTITGSPSTGQVIKWSTATSQWTNQADAGIDGLYADPNPSLGGNLTVMGYSIVSAAAGDIAITPNTTGNIVLDGQKWPQADGTANQILKTDGAGQLSWTTGGGGGITDVVQDTTPQLGGNLDVNGNSIVSASNGDIAITPNGTGAVILDGNEFPQTQGAVGQILVADGSGLLEWANQEKLTAKVINADSVTINKGEPVYVFSAQGDLISVKRALNTGDSTSAQTLGLAETSIAASAEGLVVCQGVLTNVDTSTYTAGQALYLGATAGSVTTTKPSEPNHLVYLGFVEKINAVSGRIYVLVQNGYELGELHDVNINNATALADNHLLRYNSASTRWENAALDIVTDTTPQLGGSLDVNGQSIVSVSNGNITLAPNGSGKVIISGDLQIDGTTTTVNSTTLDVDDINITLAKGAANAAAANGGGITLEGPTTAATITYTSADDRWNMNKTLAATLVGNVTGTASVASTVNIGTTLSGAHYLSMFEADTGNLQTRVNTSVYYNPTSKLLSIADNNAGQIWTDKIESSKSGGASLDNFIIGATVAKNGTFAQLKMNSLVETGGTASTATGAYTFTPNAANGTVQTLSMGSATSLTFSAFTTPVAGQSITVIVTNGTGGVTTFTSTMKFPTGITKTLTAGNGSIDIITVYYNGTTYFANIAKGFA